MNTRFVSMLFAGLLVTLGAALILRLDGFQDFQGSRQAAMNASSSKAISEDKEARQILLQRSQQRERGPQSRAPWSVFRERFSNRDYAWLIENGRTNPEAGSYYYAVRALSECMRIRYKGTLQEQTQRLLAEGGPDAQLRVRALTALYEPCALLGDVNAMKEQFTKLNLELSAAGDAINKVMETSLRIQDQKLSKEIRQRAVIELLALDDPTAAEAARPAIIATGATFRGQAVPPEDERGYRFAWALTMCSYYGDCAGPETLQGHWACLSRSECDYRPTWSLVQEISGSDVMRVSRYYAQIEDSLRRRDFSAFGVK